MSILSLVSAYNVQFDERLKMTAGENQMSDNVRAVLNSSLAGRYATVAGSGAGWPYPDNDISAQIIEQTHNLACEVFQGAHADARLASGIIPTHVILSSLLESGDAFLSLAADAGAHFTTEEISQANIYRRFDIPYDLEAGEIDVQKTAELVRAQNAKLIFLDASMMLSPLPVRELREAVGPGVIISYDASHTLGLIAGGNFQSPLTEGADFLHGSTHKSFGGPNAGIIVSAQKPEDHELTKRVFGNIRLYEVNYKPAMMAAIGVTLEEQRDFGDDYADAIVNNGRLLGQILQGRGLNVAQAINGQYTNSHQVHVILGTEEQAETAFKRLQEANIDVNPTRIPFSGGQFGLRIGLSEITRRGIKGESLIKVGHIMVDVIEEKCSVLEIRNEVIAISKAHSVIGYTHKSPDIGDSAKPASLS